MSKTKKRSVWLKYSWRVWTVLSVRVCANQLYWRGVAGSKCPRGELFWDSAPPSRRSAEGAWQRARDDLGRTAEAGSHPTARHWPRQPPRRGQGLRHPGPLASLSFLTVWGSTLGRRCFGLWPRNVLLLACRTEKSVGVMDGNDLKNNNSVLSVIVRTRGALHKSECQRTNAQSKLQAEDASYVLSKGAGTSLFAELV